MLYESNKLRHLTFKYWPLITAMGLVVIAISGLTQDIESGNLTSISTIGYTIPSILAVGFIILFNRSKSKWKMVAIGRTQIIIIEDNGEQEFTWADVEYITLERVLKFYRLKIKGRDEILFAAYGIVTWLTGDESEMGVIINKMKRELDI